WGLLSLFMTYWSVNMDNIPETRKKINGRAFLKTNKEDFERYGLEASPATTGRQISLDGLHNITD
ncbi:4973_t:CDS:2, partial [Funneliformis caledonium]